MPYGVRVSRIGRSEARSFGTKMNVCNATPSRIGIISSERSNHAALGIVSRAATSWAEARTETLTTRPVPRIAARATRDTSGDHLVMSRKRGWLEHSGRGGAANRRRPARPISRAITELRCSGC